MNVLFICFLIYVLHYFLQVKAPRPTENWSATHFWVRTHQLRNTDLKHIRLFTSPFHTTLITCLHFEKVGGESPEWPLPPSPAKSQAQYLPWSSPNPARPPGFGLHWPPQPLFISSLSACSSTPFELNHDLANWHLLSTL